MAERKLPQNLEAEMNVLGCAFLTTYALEKVCEELSSDMFLSEANKRIFEAIYELHQNKIPLDSATVKNEIEKKCSINIIGGIEYLSDVIDSVITAANVDYYIDIVRDKALRRKLIDVTTNITTNAYNEESDTNDIIDDAEKRIFSVTKARKAGEFKSIGEVIRSTQEELERLAKNKTDITGVPSGFYDLDKMTSGFHSNELIILAARPAMGKTAFGLNLAVNAAISTKKSVAIFNMEMNAEQLAMRMIASAGGIELNKLRTGRLEHNDWRKVNEAMSELGDTHLYIEDSSGMTVSEIRAKCRRLATKEPGLAMVVIDYLQLIQGGAKYEGNGLAFLEFDGHIKEYELAPGQQLVIDTGYLAAMTGSCQLEIQTVPGIKNAVFGGEGLFNTVVTGPGRVWLQSMPVSQLAGAIRPFIPTGN